MESQLSVATLFTVKVGSLCSFQIDIDAFTADVNMLVSVDLNALTFPV